MPGVATVGDSITTGHGCDATATIAAAGSSTNVYINNKLAAIVGSQISPHLWPNPTPVPPPCVPHSAQVMSGSSTVTVNGKPLARLNDQADLGNITKGSADVLAN